MKRTNIYLEEDQLRLLKHIAVEEGRSFTELVRLAIFEFLNNYQKKGKSISSSDDWPNRINKLLTRVHRRTGHISSKEIESDITAAFKETRRRKLHAQRSH